MNWIIHIGYQKTGSKALQEFLAHQASRRPGTSIAYPCAGRDGIWHRPMHEQLASGSDEMLRAAVAEASLAEHALAVLSYEGFCYLERPAIEMLQRQLPEARVLLFIRRQDQLLNSMLNQLVMGHRTSLEWIEEFEAGICRYDPLMDYRNILSGWMEVFGEDKVLPVRYAKHEDIAASFGAVAGLDVVPRLASRNPNPALDANSYQMLRELKRGVADEDLPALVQAAHDRFAENFIDTYQQAGIELIDDPTRALILSIYAESNEWVRERWFPDLGNLFDVEAE